MNGDCGDLAEYGKNATEIMIFLPIICGRKIIRVKLRYVMKEGRLIMAGIEWTEMDEDRSHGATFTACTSTSSTANGSGGGGGGGATGVQVKEEKEDKDVDHFLMHF